MIMKNFILIQLVSVPSGARELFTKYASGTIVFTSRSHMDTMTSRHKVTGKMPTPSDGDIPFTFVSLDDARSTNNKNDGYGSRKY